jgi:hypothetical protein
MKPARQGLAQVNRKLAIFFQRHNKSIVILAALVTVAIYLVKDKMRERLREVSGSIEMSDYVYAIRDQQRGVMGELFRIHLEFADVMKEIFRSRHESEPETWQLWRDFKNGEQLLGMLWEAKVNAENMASHLKKDDSRIGGIEEVVR